MAYAGAQRCGDSTCPDALGPARSIADLGRNVADDAPEHVKQIAAALRAHGAAFELAIAPPSFEELDARTKLADLACPAADLVQLLKSNPDFASWPNSHPARAFVRAFERACVNTTRSDRVLANASPSERARAAAAIVAQRTGIKLRVAEEG